VRLAVSTNYELIYWDQWGSACDREAFAINMGSLAEEVANLQVTNPCYNLDNCSVQNAKDITEACEMFGGEYNFVPAYSPMLNPAEGCIADVKRAIQTEFGTMLRAPC
jgi:hypothetical protein